MTKLHNDTDQIIAAHTFEMNYNQRDMRVNPHKYAMDGYLSDAAQRFVNTMDVNVGTHDKPVILECYKGSAMGFADGGYTLIAITKSNAILCPQCALENDDDFDPVMAIDVLWENDDDMPMFCEDCNRELEPSYKTND